MSAEKFVKFVTDKLGIIKNNPTIKEFFGDGLGLSTVSSNKGIGAYAEENLKAGLKLDTLRANKETINAEKFLKNYYNKNVSEDGIFNISAGKSKDPLYDITRAFNADKLIDEGALTIEIKKNVLGPSKKTFEKNSNILKNIEEYLDKDKNKILNKILSEEGSEKNRKSIKNVLTTIIQEEYPSKSFYSSFKQFEKDYPTEILKTDFIIKNQKRIDEITKAYQLTPKSSDILATRLQELKQIFPIEQRRTLMGEVGRTVSKSMQEGTKVNPKQLELERKQIIYGFAPETANIFYRRGPENLFKARFRNLLEGQKIEGYDINLKKISSPASTFQHQHRTALKVINAFKDYGIPNEVINSLGLKNLMVLSKPSNNVLVKYEVHANNLIKQAVKDDATLRKINFKNQLGYASTKELDQIPKLNENLIKTKNKINELKNSLPEDLQLAFNPITIQMSNGVKFKPIQKFINDFVGYDLASAKATGLVKGLHRLGISKANIKKAYDKAYSEVFKEIKAGKFQEMNEQTMVAPFEKINYKFNKGGIVNLKYGNKFIRFK